MSDSTMNVIALDAPRTDTAIIPPAPSPGAVASTVAEATRIPAKRGRKPETLEQRFERLQRQLEATQQAMTEAERRKFAVTGEALLAEAEADSAFKARVVDILRRRVTTASAKADIASVLIG